MSKKSVGVSFAAPPAEPPPEVRIPMPRPNSFVSPNLDANNSMVVNNAPKKNLHEG